MQHPTWQLELDSSALVLTPCPGTKGVPLQESLAQLKQLGVAAVVTAISRHEMEQKGVESLGQQVQQQGMQWFHLAIEDDCAPDDDFTRQWADASPRLHALMAEGHKLALHCMGGSGRTGLLAAHLLLEQGWPLEQIITQVQSLRPGAFTKAVQLDYIREQAKLAANASGE
ncbi:phosphatase [Vibrio sp.]|uniref:phosphatase domain-containing putative toxin n=1 Tax=Vibrio sp. TaxID=678 RepID=UPI003D0A6327